MFLAIYHKLRGIQILLMNIVESWKMFDISHELNDKNRYFSFFPFIISGRKKFKLRFSSLSIGIWQVDKILDHQANS